jgi:ketosteroid isomerase-like protein
MTAAADGAGVEGYLTAVATQDWAALAAAVTDDVVRIGPYGDVYTGRDAYVGFLSALMPTLPGYAMDIARVTYIDDGRRAVAELSETVTVDGSPLVTPEVLLFDLTAGGRIGRVEIFTRRA